MSKSGEKQWVWCTIAGIFAAVILALAVLPFTDGIRIGPYGLDADAFIDGEILDAEKVNQGFSVRRYPAGPPRSTNIYLETLVLRVGNFAYELFYGVGGRPDT